MSETIIENIVNNLLQDQELSGDSINWANWESKLTGTTCKLCKERHGAIFDISILLYKREINAHERCKCEFVPMRTKVVGTATNIGENGADFFLSNFNMLPDYYINKKHAQKSGWKDWKGNLSEVLPGKMIGGDLYRNKELKLPHAPGRTWFEADINYTSGYRNRQRILYSSDGLIFVTYDHYQTFYEIT